MKNPKNKNRKDQQKSHIPFRLNLLFFTVFLLFVALIVRLGYLQIIKGEEYKAEVERTESTVIRGNSPRGEIYDADLELLVANEAKNTITYTRGQSTKPENMAQTAYNLAHLIDIPHSSPFQTDDNDLSMRDLKDYYFAINQEEIQERINDYISENNIKANEYSYSESLNLISDAEIMNYTDHELKAVAIYTKMNSAYALSTVNIKNENVTQDEIALVSENTILLPGVSTGTDWDRVYPQGDILNSVLGTVTSEEQGLPESDINEYLAKGYSRNDRVGISQLEEAYETVLRGSKSAARTEMGNSDDIISQEEIYAGQKGHNLILSIDLDFQAKVDQILIDMLADRRGLNNSAYAVALNPNNGQVLAMSGKEVVNGEVRDNTLGVIQNAFTMGSSMKAATVLSGYMDDVISVGNNTIVDTPIRIGTQTISSLFNRTGRRPVDDITSLQYSSNVYMSTIAMRMGGHYNHQSGQGLSINNRATITKMRQYYHQFGLGSATGIDLPGESTGQPGRINDLETGQSLFLSFGQFDTYTLMQLAQYSATIANGGTRYAPRLVSEIRETDPNTGEVGALVEEIEPKPLNHINVSDEQMKRVQEGFNLVVNGNYGYAPSIFASAPYQAAGKTGTAEAFYWSDDPAMKEHNNTNVTNSSFVGYAPFDDPQIAIAIVVPYLPNQNSGLNNLNIARSMFDAYFNVGEFAGDVEDTEANTGEVENDGNE